MPLEIVRNDITAMSVDAIVNPTDEYMSASGGADAAVRIAAGESVNAECAAMGTCNMGEAVITSAGNLLCRRIIHTVAPRWQGGNYGEENLMRNCYRSCMALAKEYSCESLAFPLIGSGTFGYPKDLALRIAMDEISTFLMTEDMLIYIVVYDKVSFEISGKLFSDIKEYIDDRYIDNYTADGSVPLCQSAAPPVRAPRPLSPQERRHQGSVTPRRRKADRCYETDNSLADALSMIDESFSQMLLRKIDESGMSDSACYKKANIDRKLFSKIRSDKNYRPSKPTVLAFAIALELSLSETEDMLRKAGFALSHSNKFDIIIEYFITHGNYNIFEINEALFAFDQSLLGG